MSPGQRKRLTQVLIALAVLALLALWLWPRPPARKAAASRPKAQPTYKPASVPAAETLTGSPEDAIPEQGRYQQYVQGKPLLDEVIIEPTRLCANHPFVVTIKAHDPEGTDPEDVMVGVNSERGSPWVGELANPGPRQILIQAFDNDGNYEQKGVTLDVEACPDVPPGLSVLANSTGAGAWMFAARLPAGSEAQGPFTFSWDTGDGHTYDTQTGYLEHDYHERKVDTLYSAYVVKVVARGKDGVEIPGLAGVQMLNPYYANRHMKGLVVPDVQVREAKIIGDEAVVRAMVRQHEGETLEAYPSEVRTVGCGKDDPHQVELGRVQTSTTRFADGMTPLEIRVPVSQLGEGCGLAFVLTGTSARKLPIHINFGAMVKLPPPDNPSAKSLPVDSDNPYVQAQLKRLDAAAKALGRGPGEPITQDELFKLEAEGTIPPLPETEPAR